MTTTPSASSNEVLLEDYLLKRGSRGRWHKRYFRFTANNNTLEYYGEKGDPNPRGAHALQNVVEISNVYVKQYHKKVIYCLKISWSRNSSSDTQEEVSSLIQNSILDEDDAGGGIDILADDEFSMDSRHSAPGTPTSPGGPLHTQEVFDKSKKSPFRVPRPKLRRNKTDSDAAAHQQHHNQNNHPNLHHATTTTTTTTHTNNPRTPTKRSVDEESITFGPRRRRVQAVNEQGDAIPNIPELVEFNDAYAQHQQPASSIATTPVSNRRAAVRSEFEQGQEKEKQFLRAEYLSARKMSKHKARKKLVNGTKIMAATGAAVGLTFVTAGVGLIGGLVALGVGAAAGGGAVADLALGGGKQNSPSQIVIACSDYAKACRWKACLEASIESCSIQKSRWGQLFVSDGRKSRAALLPASHDQSFRNLDANNDVLGESRRTSVHLPRSKVRWTPIEGGWTSFLGTGTQGIRIQREEQITIADNGKEVPDDSMDGRPCAPLKSQIVLSTSPLEAFLCLMSSGRIIEDGTPLEDIAPNSGQRASFRILERIDDHTDVVHLVFRPLYLMPAWTKPRDFVLYRYWRLEEDGSYFICFESIDHATCPAIPGYVRGEMHQVFTIAPLKKSNNRRMEGLRAECLMTAVVQVDPKGWVPTSHFFFLAGQSYAEAFAVAGLLQLLDIRDAIDLDRFVAVDSGNSQPRATPKIYDMPPSHELPDMDDIPHASSMEDDPMNYDFKFANRESLKILTSATGFVSNPPPWEEARWAEPDADAFRVRGPDYLNDRQKVNAGKSIGRLVAVDVVHVDEPIFTGLSTHPAERLQLALRKEESLKKIGKESDLPPYIFAMNIVMPGPPVYHAVFWYAVDDISAIDGSDGTPSSKLCSKFFFGPSDDFRDKTFKMIPQIVQGNFIVRKAVGSKPAIMGLKLRQYYVRTPRSFELILDCGSSQVATGVIRLSLGYAKSLAVDMGFLFEGDEDDVLPERIFGCVRCKQPVFGPHLRKVKPPL